MDESIQKFSSLELAKEKNRLMKITNSTLIWIRLFAGLLALAFGWLKLRGVSIAPMTTDISSSILLKASIVLYYFSWLFGASSDTKDQALVYLTAPNKGQIPKKAIGLMITLAIVFAILCYVDTYLKFVIALACFWFINLIAWRYMVTKLLRKTIIDSSNIYINFCHYTELSKLKIVEQYIDGSWQWWRFVIGMVMILGIAILLFTNIPEYIASNTSIVSKQFIIAFTIFVFIFSVELWIWIMRIKRRISLNTIDYLCGTYELQPKENA